MTVDCRLEVVRIPVADMDRAKGFYQGLGWRMDFDARYGDGTRRVPGPAPGRKSFGSYVSFNDSEGNRWVVEEVATRVPGRTAHERMNGRSGTALKVLPALTLR
jgi:hypothetical protein